eukprot:TRINITY_DN31406_c0_g1_i1.p1 TRINITY_DN31406_c0_g1~~TRINITY_DN31406_c0_g1_i1.p1  ORF type:complete len:425 (-),score=97.11 TRINITY_DN31406_c0_g1_i1:112-1386(-)
MNAPGGGGPVVFAPPPAGPSGVSDREELLRQSLRDGIMEHRYHMRLMAEANEPVAGTSAAAVSCPRALPLQSQRSAQSALASTQSHAPEAWPAAAAAAASILSPAPLTAQGVGLPGAAAVAPQPMPLPSCAGACAWPSIAPPGPATAELLASTPGPLVGVAAATGVLASGPPCNHRWPVPCNGPPLPTAPAHASLESASGEHVSPEAARLRLEWREAAARAEQILRGPTDPSLARCRLCGFACTGNLVVDEQVVANARLVRAMDHAWETCERRHQQRDQLRFRVLEKRKELAKMRELVGTLRKELPDQVHSFVMRSLAPSRERLHYLRRELGALQGADGFESAWSEGGLHAPIPTHAGAAPRSAGTWTLQPDVAWARYRESVQARVGALPAALPPPQLAPVLRADSGAMTVPRHGEADDAAAQF